MKEQVGEIYRINGEEETVLQDSSRKIERKYVNWEPDV
jgi:hypothetical protein